MLWSDGGPMSVPQKPALSAFRTNTSSVAIHGQLDPVYADTFYYNIQTGEPGI